MEPDQSHNNTSNVPAQTTRLIEVLQTLETHIQRQNSLKYAFLRGMIYGFGTVIGATVLVALFGGVIVAVVNTLTDEPISESTFGKALSN
jgi:hypothetical protein